MPDHSQDLYSSDQCDPYRGDGDSRGVYRVAFIGAGRVGSALGCLISHYGEPAGLKVAGYCSRTYASAHKAARLTHSRIFSSPLDAWRNADILLITTPDSSISSVWSSLSHHIDTDALQSDPQNQNQYEDSDSAPHCTSQDLHPRIIGHCSGALSADIFQGATYRMSLHPLYAVESAQTWKELNHAWWCLDGDPFSTRIVGERFSAMGMHTRHIPSSEKVRYHAAAVLASNCATALFSRAVAQLVQCGFEENEAYHALAALFRGNAEHIARSGILPSLTGPAQRGDWRTIEAHRACLTGDDRIIYDALTRELQRLTDR